MFIELNVASPSGSEIKKILFNISSIESVSALPYAHTIANSILVLKYKGTLMTFIYEIVETYEDIKKLLGV